MFATVAITAMLMRAGAFVPGGEEGRKRSLPTSVGVCRRNTLTLRVERGSQFVARRVREAAKALSVTLEYENLQRPDDKPCIESFFSSYYKTDGALPQQLHDAGD